MGSTTSLGRVSAVVVNYNGAAYLDECLASIEALEGGVDEVIVVDNASTDASLALLAARAPRVRTIALATNDGPCPARNAGMRAARNRWVLALDNDAVLEPDVLAKLVRAAENDATAAIVQPRSVFFTERTRVHYDGGRFHYAGLIALRNFYRPIAEAEGHGTLAVDCAVSVALLVDRDAALEAGGYDERFFILFEDLDLSYRLRALGRRILSVEDALVLHKGGTPGISFREGPRYPGSRVFFHSRNRWLFMAKDFGVWTLIVTSPGWLAYELVWLVFAIASGAAGAWWRGKLAFARSFAETRRLRRAFQSRRTLGDRALLVGGPLTVTPAVRSSPAKSALLWILDGWMRAWWCVARIVVR